MMRKNRKPVTALYIHIPFCQKICDYCDFPKLQYFRNFAKQYLKVLQKELDSHKINEGIETIYVGGGTPTALDDDLFKDLLKMILPFTKGVKEYTFEANPESLSVKKLKLMKKYGVNRLSIGVESTDDKILKSINRQHTFLDVQTAVNNARKIGFDNINVDLIIGLPHVLKDQFRLDLENVLSLSVDHISCYSLTVQEHTVFFNKKIAEPQEEFARELYDLAESLLSQNGFTHYEISNWAKEGKESLHNLTYWKDEHYYGVGLGAAGYKEDIRYKNTRNLQDYLAGNFVEEEEAVTYKDDKLYYLMLNLRTKYGINFEDYKARFKKEFVDGREEEISRLVSQGLITRDEKGIYPTYNGMMVLDQLILELDK